MFSLRGQKKWLLWLAALALLVFVIRFFPELRRSLWFEPQPVDAEGG